MKIEILGTGCPKCKQLYENAKVAIKQSGKEAEIVKVEDIAKITDYAVMMIPALVIDGVVKSTGKVLSADEIKAFFI
ncbi:MAG: thioredoxin family protein [Candidatus Omnitrophota bacterium]